ncbi:flavin reductase family protein [Saccharothrix coeruleofusca]|uniref:Oxidoreductase n=1 Tax=Saccharothrix coeruleofusca TaxID=33919 RepID=A0A918EG00_9PSEU|nr:flavin reductase family protein [Saccharothrix coeruleofusca]MBP2337569.1 flavin reductase (DIM6/NTAB) family NADH-FMN oxidoreductase RutF [Saccharothrix coeruleofusca]GGP64876.1 oxidoreductase [Saccharothrix coeruleofusca]
MDLAPELSGVSPTEMRATLGRFATGVVVLTVGGEHIHGMTANAFSSVSLDPPLVLCCVARDATMHGAITAAGHFATSVLRADQERFARYFADRGRPSGGAQFDPVDWLPGRHTGAPVLADALAWVECRLEQTHRAGDHSVFIGRVLGTGRGAGTAGLLFFDGAFGQADTSERRR